MDAPWVEKYRPPTLDELASREEVVETLKRLTEQSFFPHLLLFGPPGTGKTSAMLAVAQKLYGPDFKKMVLELNASDDRGIDVVRNRIQDCAASSALVQFLDCWDDRTAVKFKLIILDECDNMTKDAQMALRRMMEDFMVNVRFGLMCNHPNNLIPAIRSRCAQLRFPPLEPEMLRTRLGQIVQRERVQISKDGLETLISVSGGDMRRALNTLQFLHVSGGEVGSESVYESVGYPSGGDIDKITYHLLNSGYGAAVDGILQICTEKGYALIDVIREVAEGLMEDASLPEDVMEGLITHMSDFEIRLSGSANEKLQLLGLVGVFVQAREAIIKMSKQND